jgi:hypothetical protein
MRSHRVPRERARSSTLSGQCPARMRPTRNLASRTRCTCVYAHAHSILICVPCAYYYVHIMCILLCACAMCPPPTIMAWKEKKERKKATSSCAVFCGGGGFWLLSECAHPLNVVAVRHQKRNLVLAGARLHAWSSRRSGDSWRWESRGTNAVRRGMRCHICHRRHVVRVIGCVHVEP